MEEQALKTEKVKEPNVELSPEIADNLGSRRIPPLRPSNFMEAGASVQTLTSSTRPVGTVDILLVNPPTPDGAIWIRSQHRVGRRSRENMIWPQVSLAQMAALLMPDYTVEIIDANALRMGWDEFEKLLEKKRPKYYLTQVTAPTLKNDMYGAFLAKSLGAKTMAFGTHVTPMTIETMRPFPALDFILRGEPEMTLRELIDRFEGKSPSNPKVAKMLRETSQLQTRRVGTRRHRRTSFPSMMRKIHALPSLGWLGAMALRLLSTRIVRLFKTSTTCRFHGMRCCRSINSVCR